MDNSAREALGEFLVIPSSQSTEEEGHRWTHQDTLTFLDLYKQYRDQVGSLKIKNLKKMFDEIAKEMSTLTKTRISGSNCENRWKVVERNYKKYLDNSKLTGRGRKVFEYADIMHTILGQKKNINPILLLSSDTVAPLGTSTQNIEAVEIAPGTSRENIEVVGIEIPTEYSEIEMVETLTSPGSSGIRRKAVKTPKYRNENKRLKYNILSEIRSDRKEYYKKRLEIEEKKLLVKIRRNDLLEKNNALLERFLENMCYIPSTTDL